TVYNAAIPPSIRQARFLRDAAYYALRETVDTTINTVKTDFYTVLFDQANIANQEENLRLLQSQLNDQQNRFQAGTVPRFDVLQASVAVANQKPNVIQAQNTFNLGYIGLARVLGIEYGPDQEKVAPIKLVGNLDYHPQNFDPAAGVAAGKANRALLKQQRLNILAQVEQIRIAAAGYQPTLVAQGGLEARNKELTDDLGQTVSGWFYGATFNWNIFDGLATYGRTKQANATLREARIAYLDDVNSVVQDIQNNYLTLQQDKELIASQVLNVSEAEEAVRLSQARLSAGAGTQLDVLTSQQQLLAAQTTELQARYQYAVTLSNYERVTGTSTVYDEAFEDPLTSRRYPTGADQTGAPSDQKKLPLGAVKTPDNRVRGSGKPLQPRINASANDSTSGQTDLNGNAKASKQAPGKQDHKPLGQRDYLFEDR
ncbi:MAG: TolC family protein, partial [Gluconacetobacter diazotrophicus]|nr:TolC family protein [Gluconacetobacter diazotrophicus]